MSAHSGLSSVASQTADLFALTDEQILQIEPDAQDVELFGGERSDRMDPLREDLDLLAAPAANAASNADRVSGHDPVTGAQNDSPANASARNARPRADAPENIATNSDGQAPKWLADRMNDPQHGADARALWDGVQSARREAAAFREVFAKPEDARIAADRARTLDEIDQAYFGAAGNAPEQTSASRAQLAATMLREDPAAFREMVFAGLHALEAAGQQGSNAPVGNATAGNAPVAPPFRAASSADPVTSSPTPRTEPSPDQAAAHGGHVAHPAQHQLSPPPQAHAPHSAHGDAQQQALPAHEAQRAQETQRQQEARVAAYAAFERAANEDLERHIGGAIERSLQQALPNASRSEDGAGLKQRLAAAVRQDVEKALQGDRALGEQVARILSGQRLDNTARAQVVRLIGERAQQLLPGATRRVLADWTQTTLAAHGAHGTPDQGPARQRGGEAGASATVDRSAAPIAPKSAANAQDRSRVAQRSSLRDVASSRSPRKIDYRRFSDDDILNA